MRGGRARPLSTSARSKTTPASARKANRSSAIRGSLAPTNASADLVVGRALPHDVAAVDAVAAAGVEDLVARMAAGN